MIFFLSIALSYKYIIEQQPIGRELFRQFCETQPEYKKSIDFLDAVVSMSSDFSFSIEGTMSTKLVLSDQSA